jgi:drug/metabolite transporter (DMT)-like permease
MQDPPAQQFPPRAQTPLAFGLTALMIGNLALAFGPWFVRMADTGPIASAFWRVAIAAPLLFVIAAQSGQFRRVPSLGMAWLFALAGLLFAADLAAWHLGIGLTKLANANLLGNSTSFLLPLWAFVAARHVPSGRQAAGLALAGLGTVLLMGQSFELSPDNLGGDLLCLLAGGFYTAYLLLMARARGNDGPWPSLAWVSAASAPPLLIAALALGEVIMPTNWTPLLLLALLSQIVGQGLMIYAIGRVAPLVFGLLLLVQPVVAALIGWALYDEALGIVDGAGALLIGLALLIVRQPED